MLCTFLPKKKKKQNTSPHPHLLLKIPKQQHSEDCIKIKSLFTQLKVNKASALLSLLAIKLGSVSAAKALVRKAKLKTW